MTTEYNPHDPEAIAQYNIEQSVHQYLGFGGDLRAYPIAVGILGDALEDLGHMEATRILRRAVQYAFQVEGRFGPSLEALDDLSSV